MSCSQYLAAKNGNLYTLKTLLQGVEDPSSKLLHAAAGEGHKNVVEYLAQRYPKKINERDDLYQTALHLATGKGHFEVVQLLLSLDNIERDCKDGYHQTVLHIASSRGYTRIVAEAHGVALEVNSKDIAGRTPLHYAALNGHADIVQELIAIKGADRYAKDYLGCTPLHLAACDENAHAVLEYLLLLCKGEKRMISSLNDDGLAPIHLAAHTGNALAVNRLLVGTSDSAFTSPWCQSPLHVAAAAGHVQVLSTILDHSVRCRDRDRIGRTALHYAAMNDHPAVVDKLLSAGLVDEMDMGGFTALHLAAREGHATVVRFLVRGQSDANIKVSRSTLDENFHSWADQRHLKSADFVYSEGMSALHLAARNGHMMVVEELLKSAESVDTTAIDGSGLTAEDWAVVNGKQDQYLAILAGRVGNSDSNSESASLQLSSRRLKDLRHRLEMDKKVEVAYKSMAQHKEKVAHFNRLFRIDDRVSNIHVMARRGDAHVLAQLLQLPEVDVNEVDMAGNTAVHLAARYGHVEALKVLLQHPQTVPNMKNHWEHTPLRLAFEGKHVEACRTLITVLGDMEGDKNLGVLLRQAIRNDWFEMSAMLVAKIGSDVMNQGKDGKTPLQLAKDKGKLGTLYVELLMRNKEVSTHLLQERSGYTDTTNAILVSSTLIASLAFQPWLQPLQIYHVSALRWFWWLDNFSFYLAIATLLVGIVGALPTPKPYLMDIVDRAKRTVTLACVLMVTSIISVMGTFAVIALTITWSYRVASIAPLVVNGCLCGGLLLWFAKRLYHLHFMPTSWEVVSVGMQDLLQNDFHDNEPQDKIEKTMSFPLILAKYSAPSRVPSQF